MELTKKQAIEEHREMWRWMAEHGYEKAIYLITNTACSIPSWHVISTLKKNYI